MSTIPTPHTPVPQPTERTEEKFRRLAALWLAETAYVSSSSDLVAHHAFQEIGGLGRRSSRCCFGNWRPARGHWHRALRRITGIDPVPAMDRGDIEKTGEAWLRWGKEQGYQW